jgi:hypothetical protein
VDEAPENAFVFAVGIDGIVPAESTPAEKAASIVIEGRRIQEWRATIRAQVLGQERFGRMQTSGTNRTTGKILEGFVANSAIVREDEVEQRRGKGPYCAGIDDRPNFLEPSTGEDAPPPKQEHSSTNLIRLINREVFCGAATYRPGRKGGYGRVSGMTRTAVVNLRDIFPLPG